MGNCHCAPRLKGENLKNYLQRKFFPNRRKRKIHNLVEMALCGDDQDFKKTAGWFYNNNKWWWWKVIKNDDENTIVTKINNNYNN